MTPDLAVRVEEEGVLRRVGQGEETRPGGEVEVAEATVATAAAAALASAATKAKVSPTPSDKYAGLSGESERFDWAAVL